MKGSQDSGTQDSVVSDDEEVKATSSTATARPRKRLAPTPADISTGRNTLDGGIIHIESDEDEDDGFDFRSLMKIAKTASKALLAPSSSSSSSTLTYEQQLAIQKNEILIGQQAIKLEELKQASKQV